MPFRTLLYRYLFFGWLFRDVTRGTALERTAAWRHNQAQARWLRTYLRRWLAIGVGCFVLGAAVEVGTQATWLALVFYLPSACSVSADAVIAVAWLGLRLLPPPA